METQVSFIFSKKVAERRIFAIAILILLIKIISVYLVSAMYVIDSLQMTLDNVNFHKYGVKQYYFYIIDEGPEAQEVK